MHHRPVTDLLPGMLRNLLPGLLIFTFATAPISPITSDAFAKFAMPTPGLETMKSGYPAGHPDEVSDFEPHYGIIPITVGAPIPTYGRGDWCYGPILLCTPFTGCWCIPLPYNWCEYPLQCLETNIINLEATLLIKHAWPKGGARLGDASNLTVLKPDNYYRDLCVSGADLKVDQFDPQTGQFIVPRLKDPNTGQDIDTPANSQLYDITSTGTVSSAKPVVGSCMPRFDSHAFANRDPKYALPTNGNAAFSYYVNADNDPFSGVGDFKQSLKTIYGTTNDYLATTFFLSGRNGCPSEISGIPISGKVDGGTPEKTAQIWKDAAAKCYDYFIFERATHPEWTLERPGSGADDPLTFDKARGGDPDKEIFESCQPLMSGTDSRAVYSGLSPVGRGYAPVLQYQRPDLDEADYSPKNQLQKNFAARFPGIPIPVFQDIFPCVKNMADQGSLVQTDWSDFNDTLIDNYAISFFVEFSVLHLPWGPQYFKPMKNLPYGSPGQFKAGFCPNVEKINLPTDPFAPRNDYQSLAHPKGISFPQEPAISQLQHDKDLYDNAILTGNNPFSSDNLRDNMFTDRDYSYQTSYMTPGDRIGHLTTWTTGYSDYNSPSKLISISGQIDRAKHPEVMCAVVPVDILEPRRKAFDSCIMERINFNFITWRRRNFLSYYYSTQTGDGGANLELPVAPIMGDVLEGVLEAVTDVFPMAFSALAGRDGTLKPWKKPCVTRFYESDTFDDCPVAMSIQQCCRIIVKDVVPMNYIKIRTCEGLREKRDIMFGYDHLYDYSEKVTDTFKDDWAIANAKTEADREKAEQIVLIKNLDSPVPISSQGGRSVKTPTSQDEFDAVYDMNQKLTMVGCDGTEPDTYAFSYYVPLSKWSNPKVTGSPAFDVGKTTNLAITLPIAELQKTSDAAIADARRLASTAIATDAFSTAWGTYQSTKDSADAGVNRLKADADKANTDQQVAIREGKSLQNDAAQFATREGVMETALGARPPEDLADILIAAGAAVLEAGTDTGEAFSLTKAYEIAKSAEQATLAPLESQAKTLAANWLKARQDYIINQGAEAVNTAIKTGMDKIKEKGPDLANGATDMFDKLINVVPGAKLALITEYGEGGAHMPYMRHWDTGTSAGNPLHGGSFINTLGSYDVIIGVGTEERSYDDATNKTTDVVTVQDAGAVAAAYAKLVDARNKLQGLYSGVQGGTEWEVSHELSYQSPIYSNTSFAWNNDKTAFYYIGTASNGSTAKVPAAAVCSLWHGHGYGNASDCNDYINGMNNLLNQIPSAQKAVAAAEAAFEAARHQSITTVTDTADQAHVPPGEAIIQAAHMGRIGGWDGLKGHQMLSLYRRNLSCIGRYEKLFKGLGQENFVLSRAGTTYVPPKPDSTPIPWPLAWRGFINDPENEFEKHLAATGLDNAQPGDIAIFMLSGMKKLGYVTYVNKTDPQFVKIESWDQGKFPTAAGASLTMGNSVDRTIYKTKVPPMERIDNLAAGKAAKVDGQPSCEDPSYTSCKLGGALDIIGEKGAVAEHIPNSTWDTVEIYRPSADTDTRQCPMVNSKKDGNGHLIVPLDKVPADRAAFCINAGFDPPLIDPNVGSKGAGAGAIDDVTLCGPEWGTCKVATEATAEATRQEIHCFPGGDVCSHPGTSPLPPPPTDEDDGCTAEEYAAASQAYQADVKKLADEKKDFDPKIQAANKAVQDAADALNDYKNGSIIDISTQKVQDAVGSANQQITALNNTLADAQQKLADAQAMPIPAPILGPDGVTVTNQADIDSATSQRDAEIERWTEVVDNTTAEIDKQSTVLCVAGELTAAIDDLKTKQAAAVAARKDLNDYLASHTVTDDTSAADTQTIEQNYAALRDKFDKATKAAADAQANVDQITKLLDCISPPTPATKQQQDAANAQIKKLQDKLTDAQNKADALQQDLNKLKDEKVPHMSCPYIPFDQQQ